MLQLSKPNSCIHLRSFDSPGTSFLLVIGCSGLGLILRVISSVQVKRINIFTYRYVDYTLWINKLSAINESVFGDNDVPLFAVVISNIFQYIPQTLRCNLKGNGDQNTLEENMS